jgi:hypothetical protein
LDDSIEYENKNDMSNRSDKILETDTKIALKDTTNDVTNKIERPESYFFSPAQMVETQEAKFEIPNPRY